MLWWKILPRTHGSIFLFFKLMGKKGKFEKLTARICALSVLSSYTIKNYIKF